MKKLISDQESFCVEPFELAVFVWAEDVSAIADSAVVAGIWAWVSADEIFFIAGVGSETAFSGVAEKARTGELFSATFPVHMFS